MKNSLVIILFLLFLNTQGAVLTVTNTNDLGSGSLRATIGLALSGDTIEFSSSLLAGGNDTIGDF